MVYLLYGSINYLIKDEINKIIKENNIFDINISKYDLTVDSMGKIINDAISVSLFSEKKLIIVNNSIVFTSLSKIDDNDINSLENYLNNINESTILIFITSSLDERKKIVKLMHKKAIIKEFNNTDITDIVKKLFDNYIISLENIKFLIERVGDDINLLSTEIDKIKIFKDNDLNITKEDIINLTSKSLEVNNFKLIDAIISKNKKMALELYYERTKLNEEPIAIIISVANQIRIMYQVKNLYMNGYSENEIAKILEIHPYRVKLANQNSKKYDEDLLLNYLKQLSNLDINIKTGNIDKNMGLELFILSL